MRNHCSSAVLTLICCLAASRMNLAQVALYDNLDFALPTSGTPIGPRFVDSTELLAQQFRTTAASNVSSVGIHVQRVGSPTGNVSVQIWTDTGTDAPSEPFQTIGAFDVATLSTTGEIVRFPDLNVDLLSQTPYYVVLDNSETSINSAQDSYRIGMLGLNEDDQAQGTNDAAFVTGSAPAEFDGSWIPLRDPQSLGCHPQFGCPNFLRMSVEATNAPHVAVYDNMELAPIDNIPGAIGPRFTSHQEDLAQQFLMGEQTNISSVSLLLNRVGSPTGEVSVEIWEDRQPGQPSSLVTSVGTIDLAELSTTPEEVTFDTLVTGLTAGAPYHVVLNNLGTSINSAQDSYRFAVLGSNDDVAAEGTNGAAFLLGSSPEEFQGAWTPVPETLGCHPTGGCPNYLRMHVESATLLGDFDEDGALDADDIDALTASVHSGSDDRSFDLNNSAKVDFADRDIWIEQLATTRPGDADLDGEVDFPDFLALSAGFGASGGWAEGDFDGNGQIDFADFLTLSNNFGPSGAPSAPVPEPSSLVLLLAALMAGRYTTKRR